MSKMQVRPTTPFLPPHRLILASTSPRRREFIEILGIPFTVVAPGLEASGSEVDETPLPNETPDNLVQRLSQLKAKVVANNLSASPSFSKYCRKIIIAADTVVVFKDKILGKPKNAAEATQMLKLLRQHPHSVVSGLTVAHSLQNQTHEHNWQFVTRLHQSKVWMRSYTDAEITAYIATGSPLDKAGAYGIQDRSFAPVSRLEGCFASVMGLPLAELALIFKEMKFPLPEISPLCSQHTGAHCCWSKI